MRNLLLISASMLLGLTLCLPANAKLDTTRYAHATATVVITPVPVRVHHRHPGHKHYYRHHFRYHHGLWWLNGKPYVRYYRHGEYIYRPYRW